MCIIAIYKNGKRPTKQTLDAMIDRNPDGCGVAWNDGRSVHWKKGFNTTEAVLNYITRISRYANDIVFHARISTSGGISAQKCHPFLLSARRKDLDALSGRTNGAVAFHNGVFSITPEKGLNDTQTFIKNALAPIRDAVIDGKVDDLIELAVKGSRFVIVTPQGLKQYGSGWTEDGGVIYSNTSFRPYHYYKYGSVYGEWVQERQADGSIKWVWISDEDFALLGGK